MCDAKDTEATDGQENRERRRLTAQAHVQSDERSEDIPPHADAASEEQKPRNQSKSSEASKKQSSTSDTRWHCVVAHQRDESTSRKIPTKQTLRQHHRVSSIEISSRIEIENCDARFFRPVRRKAASEATSIRAAGSPHAEGLRPNHTKYDDGSSMSGTIENLEGCRESSDIIVDSVMAVCAVPPPKAKSYYHGESNKSHDSKPKHKGHQECHCQADATHN